MEDFEEVLAQLPPEFWQQQALDFTIKGPGNRVVRIPAPQGMDRATALRIFQETMEKVGLRRLEQWRKRGSPGARLNDPEFKSTLAAEDFQILIGELRRALKKWEQARGR